jgi:glycolate oxidase FAD binding subunit
MPATRTDVVLSTSRLRAPIEHCAGDLTVTAPAGATLAEINAVLARDGQWLPLDPWAGGRSTIGGLIATNDSGPRRHRSGAPRDLVIGIEFALVDGTTAKGGGRVVKNVAGYDMGRLLCGSFGTLAVITSATFKLSPLPPSSRTVVIDVPSYAALTALSAELAASPATPSAVEVALPGPRLLVRFETTPTAAAEQAAHVMGLAVLHGAAARVLDGAAEDACWTAHHASVSGGDGALLRVSVLPTHVAGTLANLEQRAATDRLRVQAIGRALLGSLLVQVDGEAAAIADLIQHIRPLVRTPAGHLSVLSAPAAVTAAVPVWDELGAATGIMRAVKAQFDPHGTLCPGGGPGGLA